jgi:hypothetical protein
MKICIRTMAAVALVGSLAAGPALGGDYKFTTVDGPAPNDLGTRLTGINNYGLVAGVTYDADYNEQLFFGPPAGGFTTFNVPFGSGSNFLRQTQVTGINDYPVVLAYRPSPRSLGFVMEFSPFGFLPVNALDAVFASTARGLNNAGAIAGSFSQPGRGGTRGLILDPWGHLTAFDATPYTSITIAMGINNYGTAVGQYVSGFSPGMVFAGFLRDASGKITLLPTPQWIGGVAVGSGGVYYSGINDNGVTVGSFLDPSNNAYGFVRDAAGNFTLIQLPGASVTGGVVGINNSGTIAGNFFDQDFVEHGFIATPSAAP